MIPRIVEKGSITLVGMDFCGDPYVKGGGWSEENKIGKLWQRFMSFYEKNKDLIENKVSESGYEVWVETGDMKATKGKYIFVGVEVECVGEVPLELVAKVLPATTYAVFTVKEKDITSDWSTGICKEWLPQSGYRESHPFLIEYCDAERFKGMDNSESELDVYVPITERDS